MLIQSLKQRKKPKLKLTPQKKPQLRTKLQKIRKNRLKPKITYFIYFRNLNYITKLLINNN